MGLSRYRVGELVLQYKEECGVSNLRADQVSGINADKEFFEPAKQVGQDTSKYRVVPCGYYACNLMHVGRDVVLPIALNRTARNKIVSPAYSVFQLVADEIAHPEYLYMLFNSTERDRYFWFHTDGSVRDGMSWDDFCACEIELPPIEVQRKYVAIYEAMLANQRAYKRGLDDLKLTCDALVEKLMRELPHEAIGLYIEQCDDRNSKGEFDKDAVRGLSISKQLIETKANLDGVNLCNYKVIAPGAVAYVPVTSRNGGKISIALNESNETNITSAINTVFRVKKSAERKLLPGYLMLFFGRSEFDRYARFNSWGSARETFDWAEMCDVRIPLPDIAVQRYAVELYQAWRTRHAINEQLKAQLKNICPILIRGSIEEASK